MNLLQFPCLHFLGPKEGDKTSQAMGTVNWEANKNVLTSTNDVAIGHDLRLRQPSVAAPTLYACQ